MKETTPIRGRRVSLTEKPKAVGTVTNAARQDGHWLLKVKWPDGTETWHRHCGGELTDAV